MRRKSYREVFESFKDRGYTLITEEYQNNKQRLEYICPKHPDDPQTTRLNDLLSGHGCKLCGRDRSVQNLRRQADLQRLTYDEVREEIEKEGFTLLTTEYENAKIPIEVQCPKGHKFRTRISDFRKGKDRCPECAVNKTRTPYEEVKKAFEDRGYKLIDKAYVNQDTPLRYTCPKHPEEIKTITFNSIKGGHGCHDCGIESISGVNSVHYNHDLTDEEREHNRSLDPKEREWRVQVFQRDKFNCQYCGRYNRNNVNAHHKDAHHWCIERRYDVSNGATLCVECHRKFHSLYGYKNNTEEQFDEWVNGKEAII